MRLHVAGIDPSLRNLGLAEGIYDTDAEALEMIGIELQETESEAGKTVRKSSDDLRCAGLLTSAVHRFIAPCAVVFAEIPSGSQSARGSFSNGICLGVLASIGNVGGYRGRLIQVNPYEVKRAAVGSKNASKEEMIHWAHERWPKLPWLTKKQKGVVSLIAKNEHMADACAAINAGIQTDEFRNLVQIVRATSSQGQYVGPS